MPTIKETRDLLDKAARVHETSLTLYYIGNCSLFAGPQFDDRSWAICFNDFRTPSRAHSAPHNLVLGSTDELLALTPRALAGKLYDKYNKLAGIEHVEGHRVLAEPDVVHYIPVTADPKELDWR